jgi:hypothetical protein
MIARRITNRLPTEKFFQIRAENFGPLVAKFFPFIGDAACRTGMSAFTPISSALPLKADVAAVGRESPKMTQSGSRRFVLTNLKYKSEIRIVARILLTFEGREVRSGDALSFPRNIG